MTNKSTAKVILIVDDEPRYLRLLEANLRTEGYDVITAEDGGQAVEILININIHVDLVLLDVMMPRLDGFAACQRIREFSNIPIIFLTARGEEQDRVRGLDLGADDYLVKPFSSTEILARVRAVLHRTNLSNEEKLVWRVKYLEYIISNLRVYNQKLESDIKKLKGVKSIYNGLAPYKNLMAATAHSIKGELGHIKPAADNLLELSRDHDEGKDEHEMIVRSCDYSFLLLQNVMNFLEMGSLQNEIIDLKDLIATIEPLMRLRLPSKVDLKFVGEKRAKKILVIGDSIQIIGILKELIDNAIAELRGKGGIIEVHLKQNKDKALILVKDTGAGIPKEIRENLFKEQVLNSKGTGWGLYLCYKTIKSMGGDIKVKSTKGKGTEFIISFVLSRGGKPQ